VKSGVRSDSPVIPTSPLLIVSAEQLARLSSTRAGHLDALPHVPAPEVGQSSTDDEVATAKRQSFPRRPCSSSRSARAHPSDAD
jgi:hypothetical protein